MPDKKTRFELSAKDTELLYRYCEGCKLSKGRITVAGGHCSFDGTPKLVKNKCATRK